MASSQIELAVNTHVAVMGGRREVADVHQEVTSMRKDMSVIKKSISNKLRAVCRCSLHQRKTTNRRSDSSEISDDEYDWLFNRAHP